ncbi:MAG: acetyl-CoA carboxylase biotin carboxylase subunit [Bacteroidota bacterium]|jgi:acetyl-CoA carboxylase biotin carboxylase subunit
MEKILVANRGEIALRIMRTIKKLGKKAVAVYSEADINSLHVQFADEAYCIGPAQSSSSYLKGDLIIETALKAGVDGIHPGYGFLSENADFALKVAEAGITFIGPSAETIDLMGNKIAARETVRKQGVPLVPGNKNKLTTIEQAREIAIEIGYPILIKAAAGGGGKGMRKVMHADELESQMQRAQSEAKASFGDDSVFVEKYVSSPRHIEFQILADHHGNIVHLFERECSIQRRHQKLIEEAPSAVLSEELRNKMGNAAVQVARSCDYRGAGTVEFIFDENHQFYFLEMNTRLQVEHPVTELITGLDLVALQIAVAEGEKLPFSQEEIKRKGHAIELRICAEDPFNQFLPSTGILTQYGPPKMENIRLDDAFTKGMEVSIYYDPLVGKLIAYGINRQDAIRNLLEAIKRFEITGIETTLPFGKFVCEHPKFILGDFDTHFIENYFRAEDILRYDEKDAMLAGKIALALFLEEKAKVKISHS